MGVGHYLSEKLVEKKSDLFIRLPVVPLLKDSVSLLQKAFYRQKEYRNPYADIEDKVGLRFVVLLSEDIRFVEDAVKTNLDFWDAQMSRDFLIERAKKPLEFGYQSLHYIVYAKYGLEYDGIDINEGTPCEIQIRTLLQHAYSELTHDTIYKPSVIATPEMQRAAAKSIALIEATDDYFSQVNRLIVTANAEADDISLVLDQEYEGNVGHASENGALQSLLVDSYKDQTDTSFASDFRSFLEAKPFIFRLVRERRETSPLYRVSAVLLLYYAVSRSPNSAAIDAVVDSEDLDLIYSDLGLQAHGY